MKKIIFLIAMVATVSIANSKGLAVDFDGKSDSQIANVLTHKKLQLIEVPSIVGVTKASASQSYGASFSSEYEASQALPGLVRKFESVGCVILTSKINRAVDAAYGVSWNVLISYLPPAQLTTQTYGYEFYNQSEAQQALPGIIKKFEGAGCVILTSRVINSPDAAGDIHWYISLSYLTSSGLTGQKYSAMFNNEYEARQALPGLLKKFEAAGYVIVMSRVESGTDGANVLHWFVSLSYIQPAK